MTSPLLELSLRRNMSGKVEVYVKADPSVEEMMEGISIDGTSQQASDYGRYWSKSKDQDDTLRVYEVEMPRGFGHGIYTLNQVSSALCPPSSDDDQDPYAVALTNLSFLRLVGIKDGVRFQSDEMLSRQAVESLAKRINSALRVFFEDFMREFSLNIVVERVQ